MRYLLDTSVLIAGDTWPGDDELAVASTSFAELELGVHAAADPLERARRSARLDRLRAEFAPGLPFDDDAARAFGVLCSLVLGAGRNPRARTIDLMIAATARAHDAGVMTRNPDDFAHVAPLVPVVVPPR